MKRWTREVYRRQREPIGIDAAGLDIVVNVKPNAVTAPFEDYSRELTRALARVSAEARRTP